MKRFIFFLLVAVLACEAAYAGRMPSEIVKVENAGAGYVTLYSANPGLDGEFNVVQTFEVKRLVGSAKENTCYMFYFTGVELLKLPVTSQSCADVLAELKKSQQ